MDIGRELTLILVLSPLGAALLTTAVGILGRARPLSQVTTERLRAAQIAVTVLASCLSLALAVVLATSSVTKEPLQFQVDPFAFYLDALSVYFVLLVSIVALFASLYIGPYLDFESKHGSGQSLDPTAFHFFFNIFHFTMVLVPVVNNLVILWIAVELTTLASTILVGYRQDQRALEAAWKYIITTSTGIIFALLGTLFLANAIRGEPGITSFNWSDIVTHTASLNKEFVRLSFLFILIGYGTKAGFAPMHTWLPDGHGEAPYPVSALLSGVLLKSALYAILRFYTITNRTLQDGAEFTSRILLVAGLFSLVLAVPFILKENRFKRILAYHSLEHMGIITFGLGIGGEIAVFGALLHALNHALTKALMFLAFGNVQTSYAGVGGTHEERYVGILRAMPGTGTLLALGGLALVGSPPFNIFYSEFIILWAALAKAWPGSSLALIAAVALFLLSVTLIFAGLTRHLGHMLVDLPPDGVEPERAIRVAPLFVLLLVVILFGVTIPVIGAFNLPELLKESVKIVIAR